MAMLVTGELQLTVAQKAPIYNRAPFQASVPVSYRVSGLTLGKHTIRITNGTATQFYSDTVDIITPIHSYKPNLNVDFQNNLSIGSCGISDNRITSPIQSALPGKKAWAQAIGRTTVTTVITTFLPLPDMSLMVKTITGDLRLTFTGTYNTGGGGYVVFYVDGIQVMPSNSGAFLAAISNSVALSTRVKVSPGTHKIDVYWRVPSGTGTMYQDGLAGRVLTVEEI